MADNPKSIESLAKELCDLVYAHHVIKYDPDAAQRCAVRIINEALATPTTQPTDNTGLIEPVALTYRRMGSQGRCDFKQLREAVSEAGCGNRELAVDPDARFYPGHMSVSHINYNSLDRIVTAFVDAALAAKDAKIAAGLALLERAQEELRMIRMKDSAAVYDIGLRSDLHAAIGAKP